MGGRDRPNARRFVAGVVLASLIFFVAWYPNLAALPLPSAIVNAYQGFLPTYLYAFQFPVNTDPVIQGLKLIDGPPIVLLGFLLVTCVIVGYSAWTWRIAIAERDGRSDAGTRPSPRPARRAGSRARSVGDRLERRSGSGLGRRPRRRWRRWHSAWKSRGSAP